VIYDGSFSISIGQGYYCGAFEYVPFQATAGEEIQGTLTSTKDVSFYVLTANDWVVDGLGSGTGGRCNVPSYQLSIGNTQSKAFNFTAATTGKYYFIVFLFSYSNGLTADVTLNSYSTNVQTFPLAIYSSATTVLVATFTQTISSYYTQQAQALSGGDNLSLIIATLLVVVIAIAAAYLLSHRKKATRDVTKEPKEMICKKCGSELLPKAKFCKKCGTPI
jgi:hypothetical protein